MYRRVYFTRIKYITLVSRRRVKITRLTLPLDFATLVAQDTLPSQRKVHSELQGFFGVSVV